MPSSSPKHTVTSRSSLAALLFCLVGFGVAGCQVSREAEIPAVARAGQVTGQVFYLQRIAVLPGTTLDVRLVDVTDSTNVKTIARDTKSVQGIPVPYVLKFKPAEIREGRLYQVRAEMTMGGRVWTHTQQYPVLTGGAPNYAEIVVSPK